MRLVLEEVLVDLRELKLFVIELLGHTREVRLAGALLHEYTLIMYEMILPE